MKKAMVLFFIVIQLSIKAQNVDSLAIINVAQDYAEGWYSGDPVRMERALHPDFNKARPFRSSPTSGITFNYSTNSQLIEGARAKAGLLDESKRKLTVTVLNVNGVVANIKVNSSQFNDYLQLLKIDNQWKIVNVLWTVGIDSKDRMASFDPLKEKESIEQSAKTFIDGLYSCDIKSIEIVIANDFNRLSFTNLSSGKTILTRYWSTTLIDNCLQKKGYVSEPQRIYNISVLDAMEGLAVVTISTPRRFEYLQMYKDGDKWKVFHSLIQNNPDYSFNTSLVQSVGHPMSDFTLPVYQGGDFTLSKEKGKNVILLFPRGWLGDHWCQVCQYQYAEFLELIKTKRLLEKYNCEVVFVLPYSKEKVDDWVSRFNDGLRTLEGWKQSTNKEFAEYITTNYTKKTDLKNDEFTIPILVDAEGKLSQRFQLFTSFWDGIRSEQNIPTIFIVDKQGIIQFKYHSQSTFDRPSADYLVKYLKNLQN